MSKLESRIPNLRFKGFDGEWNKCFVDDVIKLRSESGDQNKFLVDIELENLVSDQGIVIGDTSVRTQTNSIFRSGDILFGRLRPYLNKWWLANVAGVKSGEIWALYPQNNYSNTFIYGLVRTSKFLNYVNLTSGTKMPRADWSVVREQSISAPDVQEQTQIGNFFQKLDQVIELQQKALSAEQDYKKSMLQKMFPQQGEKVPKVRFKGFDGDWSKFCLGDIGKSFNGLSGKTKEHFGTGLPFITYRDIFANSGIKNLDGCNLVNINSTEKQNMVQKGDMFFTTSSETPNEVGFSSVLLIKPKINTYLNSFCFGVRMAKPDILSPEFAQYLFRSPNARKKIELLAQGSTRFNISKTNFMKLNFIKTSLEEQKKIGTFFQKLDQRIEQHENKLKNYQDLKKAMLQRLFV